MKIEFNFDTKYKPKVTNISVSKPQNIFVSILESRWSSLAVSFGAELQVSWYNDVNLSELQ